MINLVRERQLHLIETNLRWLWQAQSLLGRINDSDFVASPAPLAPQRAGAHIRHIVEFYECFLDGLESAHIDYDGRKRDLTIETDRRAALARIGLLIKRLENEHALHSDFVIRVRLEDAQAIGIRKPFLVSSVARELQVLSSHTVHHFALIAIILRMLDVPVAADFGVAPSTLRYWASQASEEAA
jgi:hypothetical protein